MLHKFVSGYTNDGETTAAMNALTDDGWHLHSWHSTPDLVKGRNWATSLFVKQQEQPAARGIGAKGNPRD